jgi:hypothetical protein
VVVPAGRASRFLRFEWQHPIAHTEGLVPAKTITPRLRYQWAIVTVAKRFQSGNDRPTRQVAKLSPASFTPYIFKVEQLSASLAGEHSHGERTTKKACSNAAQEDAFQ